MYHCALLQLTIFCSIVYNKVFASKKMIFQTDLYRMSEVDVEDEVKEEEGDVDPLLDEIMMGQY